MTDIFDAVALHAEDQWMSKERLAEIEARLAAATPAPWEWQDWDCYPGEEPDIVNHTPVLAHTYPGEGNIDVLPWDRIASILPMDDSPFASDTDADYVTRYTPNAELIAAAPEYIGELLREVKALRELVHALAPHYPSK